MSDKVQKMLENQRKREEAMREKELKRKQEEEEKKKNPPTTTFAPTSPGNSERFLQEQEYARKEFERKKAAEETRQRELEEIDKRAEERKAALLAGEDIREGDYKDQVEKERKLKEKEKEMKRRENEKAAAKKMKEMQAAIEAKGGSITSSDGSREPPIDLGGAKNYCIWGCQCDGFDPAPGTKLGPILCKKCSHAKSLHK